MSNYKAGWVSLDGFVPVLAQWDDHRRWNGWLCPSFDALSVVKVLDTLNEDNDEPVYMYDWTDEGFLMLVDVQDEDGGIEFVQPDADGLYRLGYAAWVWQEERRIIGTFRAIVTRDGEAQARDGQPYIDITPMEETDTRGLAHGGDLFEVQFTDGVWMLVRAADLVAGAPRA